MEKMVFKKNDVLTLIQDANINKQSLYPTLDDLWSGVVFDDGIPRDDEGLTEQQVKKRGGYFWPSAAKANPKLIKPRLVLVGDHGVYLLNNVHTDKSPTERQMVFYALGCNPELDEDFYEQKEALFGGDDGTITLDIHVVLSLFQKSKRADALMITLSETSCTITVGMYPKATNKGIQPKEKHGH